MPEPSGRSEGTDAVKAKIKAPHKSPFWYVFLFATLACGMLLVLFGAHCLPFVPQLSSRVRPGAGGTLVGIMLISAVVAHFVIYWLMRGAHALFRIAGNQKETVDLWPPAILGVLESSLYTLSLVVGRAEFIGFWVAAKTAGGWVAWSGSTEQNGSQSESERNERLNKARRRFYSFLIGNALVIIAALLTYGALKMWVLKSS